MLHRTVPSPKGTLSLHEVLQLTDVYLENASRANSNNVALVLCHNAEVALTQAKTPSKKESIASDADEQVLREKIAAAYYNLGKLLESHGYKDEAEAFFKKCKKWGGHGHVPAAGQHVKSNRSHSIVSSTNDASPANLSPDGSTNQLIQSKDFAIVTPNIFPKNLDLPTINFKLPEPDSRLIDTNQLACCLALLQNYQSPDDVLGTIACDWIQLVKSDQDECDRLQSLATDVIRAFKRDEFKDAKAVAEVILLAPILEKSDFRYLLKEFHSGIEQSTLLDVYQLEGLAQLIQGADASYLDADDLVKVLALLSTRLQGTHRQSPQHLYQLTLAVSNVLDAMADADVNGLDRETTHEPLKLYLDGLQGSADPYLVYQAAYAYQALLYVPDNESIWQATLRRTGKVLKGVSGLVSAVKGLDLSAFIDGLVNIHNGLSGASQMGKVIKDAYEGTVLLAQGGKGFLDSLKEGLSFSNKSAWYPAIRGADTMIQEGRFADFRRLVCEAPCRRDIAFQWGVCQRLGDIAANMDWDQETRRGSATFLSEIYKDDDQWGQHARVKQWILSILMQLSSEPGDNSQFVESLFQELGSNGDASKRELYRLCRDGDYGNHPLKVGLPALGSPSLLDRVQERPDVEGIIRQLRRQRMRERGNAVYISPQAKASLHARDDLCFPLMEKVDEFLLGDQKVFLLLGDSGAGKSTFIKELEYRLWQTYRKEGAIPIYVNLPSIDKPEHDMIAKQLRKVEFTEPQIRELKLHRTLVLICDGYDESQQTHNLYASNRLNIPGEWNAKMVISCRSEYLGVDYRDRFQPSDRNQRADPSLFQEAVITPFSMGQVQEYIDQYVSLYRPLWESNEYRRALDLIPSLKDLVKNPFLMSLSLEVLPRMVDPTQTLSAIHITRVSLYDQFIEHWLERGKRRLGEKNLSPQSRGAFENLIDEGFTRNGIAYLKRLSSAIYKEQGGQPIVSYSRYKDENSWKDEFFSREEEKQLLREACPLIRGGNQHRFIHRSLLEYGVALAIFDPQEWKEMDTSESISARRRSTNSVMSFLEPNTEETLNSTDEQVQGQDSPIVWKNFVNDPFVLQFLEERVRQEPLFRKQLLEYIERSKTDKKWRTAAANAITILVRVGEQFNHADLRSIQVPGADLSYGVFESAQLQGADLRQVVFRGACLGNADLSNALMSGAQFGELPHLKHDSKVIFCAYSPDGMSLATVLDDRTINVYSTSTWERRWTKTGHEEEIWCVVYSPTGNQLASSSEDSTIRLWDSEDGRCLHVLSGHSDWVRTVAYSLEGSRVASGSDDHSVKVWDVGSGQCLHTFIGHTDYVLCVAYSPAGDQIASSSGDRSIRLWSIEDNKSPQVLSGHTDMVVMVVYSPRDEQVASASRDGTIRLWNTTTGECHYVIADQSTDYPCAKYSPKGNQISSLSLENTIQVWDVGTGSCLHTLQGHSRTVTSLTYSPSGDLIASGAFDNTVRLWDPDAGVCRQTLAGHSENVNNAVFSPKGDRVVSISDDRSARLWDIGARRPQYDPSIHSGRVFDIECSPRGRQFATGSGDNTARLWDVESRSCIHVLAGHSYYVRGIAYSPQGDYIASASSDKTVKLWSVDNGECLYTLTGHSGFVFSVSFSPCGGHIATASEDKTIRLWSTEDMECYRVLQGHDGRVWRALFSAGGDVIASCSSDCTVRLWDVATGNCQYVMTDHTKGASCLKFSPNGNQLASGSDDTSIRLWDLETGASRSVTGHTKDILAIAYSPRGDVLVSASADMTMRLWDVASGQCLLVIEDAIHRILGVEWMETTDGNYVIAGYHDGEVRMFRVLVDGNQHQLRLDWKTSKGDLNVMGTTIQDTQGLSQLNKRLLRQRGAVGDPADHFHEASEKVLRMAAVVSKLKTASSEPTDDPASKPITYISLDLINQRVQEEGNPLLRGILEAFVQNIHGYIE